jgi:uncharacterized protein YecT (DUF1311 family)
MLAAGAAAPPAVETDQSKCWDTATTQLQMNACAETDLKAADAEMNAVYQQLTTRTDLAFTKRLRAAQRAWLAFRDAHVEARFGAAAGGGSVRPMCVAIELRDLTRERTKQLRVLLKPEEGDVCAGLGRE